MGKKNEKNNKIGLRNLYREKRKGKWFNLALKTAIYGCWHLGSMVTNTSIGINTSINTETGCNILKK